MSFDLCIPAYNEAPTILETLRILRETLSSVPDVLLVVAENGSSDGTAEIVDRAQLPGVKVLRVQGKGKGMAIKAAAEASTASIFGFIDADLSADPAIIPEMLVRIADGANIVIGSRLLDRTKVRRGKIRTWCSELFHVLERKMLDVPFADTQCGLKLMDARGRDVLRAVVESGWFFDAEFLARAKLQGLSIAEVPVHWEEFRFAGRSSKLNVLSDGIEAIRAMFRIRNRLASLKKII